MTPQAMLMAAAVSLEAQKTAITPGKWVVHNMADDIYDSDDGGGWWWVWAEDSIPYYGGIVELDGRKDGWTPVGNAQITDGQVGGKERADAELIVTLHKTLDAQLSVIYAALNHNQARREGHAMYLAAVELAEAILA
jgi:hypothetical protein